MFYWETRGGFCISSLFKSISDIEQMSEEILLLSNQNFQHLN